jgi:hypothetical protein
MHDLPSTTDSSPDLSGMPDGTIPPFGDHLRALYIDTCGESHHIVGFVGCADIG